MEISEELIETIYKRAMQYCVAKYGKEPGEIHIDEGSFKAVFGYTCYGEYNEDQEYFGVDCLTADLDEVYEQRMQAEAEEQKKREAESKRQNKIREEANQRNRKAEYLKLKKEFGEL